MRSAWRTVEKRCEIRIVVHVPRGGEDAVEDLGLAAHVELGGGLVEQHEPGAQPHRAQRPGQGDALPLAAREVGAALVAAGEQRVEVGEAGGARLARAPRAPRRRARRRARRCRAAAARSG